jgi:cystathionine beta-lyase
MKKDTRIVATGRDPRRNFGIVNPPVYHASTVLFPTVAALNEALKAPFETVYYGRFGTPTTFALEEAIAELEGGHRAVAVSSGLAAVGIALMTSLKAGEHLLMVDSCYQPTRKFCDNVLTRFGVETTYYDPLIGARIAELIRPETKAVYMESPGSLTFEVQDVPAIAAAAHDRGATAILDNTWATPLFFKPFDHGIDLSVQAATKYIAGHADAMLGLVVASDERTFRAVKSCAVAIGNCAGPDDCYLGLRGLRTLSVRLERHQETGLKLARWLKSRPEVARVIHPALPDDPGHALWKRDFTGANGLFAVVLKRYPQKAVAAMLDGLELFGMGFSWGGFESLILPAAPETTRTATTWEAAGPLLRIHAGLEDPDDLIADLERGFERLNATSSA